MTKLSRRNAFYKETEALRRHPERVETAEIARRAVKAGLQPHEVLQEIRDYYFGYTGSTDVAEALALFVSSLCEHKRSDLILEYTTLPFLLTARIGQTDASHRMSFVVEDKPLADTLRILFDGRGPSIVETVANLSTGKIYGSIVCMPPLGVRPPENKAADGFGGEIIRELMPYLSEEGTLYWITGRGVVFNPRARQTLADLERLGLYAVACIETAPGAFPRTMIEGAVIALQHEMPKKRFVAMLRDLEAAKSTASAFLAGPSRKEGPNWIWLEPDDSRTFSDLEQSRLLQELTPRGGYTVQPLSALLHTDKIEKADRPCPDTDQAAAFLYVPEYAGSRVTAETR